MVIRNLSLMVLIEVHAEEGEEVDILEEAVEVSIIIFSMLLISFYIISYCEICTGHWEMCFHTATV